MKMWSRGLGRTELKFDLRNYGAIPDVESGGIQIVGQLKDPVNWEFKITITPEDIVGMTKVFLTWPVLKLFALNGLKFIGFLKHRKEYGEDNIQEKVNKAYDQMMSRAKPKLDEQRAS